MLFYFFVWRDPIFQLGLELSRNPMWLGGFATIVRLPPTANTNEIVTQEIKSVGFSDGAIKTYKIVEVGRILILPAGPVHPAVLIETNLGEKIILYRYDPNSNSWWVKIYDAP